MALVQYPDSESDPDNDNHRNAAPAQAVSKPAVKRKRSADAKLGLPPLPSAFHDLYATNARRSTSDDPSLHGGRKRAVPHIDGNWPSHVFLEWIPSQSECSDLHSLIQHVRDQLNRHNGQRAKKLPVPDITPSLRSELGATLPLHVSLSRTLQIKTQDRDAFLEKLRSCLRRVDVRTFQVAFSSLKWVPNYERNRWFLVLGIREPGHDELNRLLDACNRAAEDCGHPGLYTGGHGDGPMQDNTVRDGAKKRRIEQFEGDRSDCSEYFHISIAWNLAEPDLEWISLVQGIDINNHVQSPQASFDAVKLRIGNAVHNIALAKKRFSPGKEETEVMSGKNRRPL